jgi:hypothetical protein
MAAGLFCALIASINQAFWADFLQDGGGNFFNALVGGGQPANARAAHHGLGLCHFMAAVGQAGVFGVGAALVANFAQALGLNGQAKDFFLVRHQRGGQLATLKVFGNQRVVGCFQAVLHGQVQAGGGFATAAHAYQNHIRQLQVAVELAVVMGQAEIDGLDAVAVFLAFARI